MTEPPPNPAPFLRLFVAITVPLEVRQEIGRALERLRRNSPPSAVRWARADQFHITLKFLGDIPAEQVAQVEQSVAAVCAGLSPIHISAKDVGFFPNRHKPRVIWVGAHDDGGRLVELHRQLDDALRWLTPAERIEKFTGHITLGRFKPGHHAAIPKLLEQAAHFANRDFGAWQAEEVELVRSKLTAIRAEHFTQARFRLTSSKENYS